MIDNILFNFIFLISFLNVLIFRSFFHLLTLVHKNSVVSMIFFSVFNLFYSGDILLLYSLTFKSFDFNFFFDRFHNSIYHELSFDNYSSLHEFMILQYFILKHSFLFYILVYRSPYQEAFIFSTFSL